MGPEQGPLVVRAETHNGVGRLALQGDLDMSTVPTLSDDLAQLESNGVDSIVLDVRDVTFADASALHAFLAARSRASSNGHRFLMVGVGRPVARLFELTGTGSLFVVPDAASILDRFAGGRSVDRRSGVLDGSVAGA